MFQILIVLIICRTFSLTYLGGINGTGLALLAGELYPDEQGVVDRLVVVVRQTSLPTLESRMVTVSEIWYRSAT